MARPESFTANPEDVKMGPAIVMYDSVQLGYTMNDSVSVNYTQTTTPIQPDQSSLPIKDYVTGIECTVDMELASVDPEIIAKIPGGDSTGLKDPTGLDMLTLGKPLILYPLDKTDDRVFQFPVATPILNGAIAWQRETPQTLPLQFKCYLKKAGDYILRFDDTSVVQA